MNIGELFTQYGSDKDTNHKYGEFYQSLFKEPERVQFVMEIGIAHGGGILAFQDFFPNAIIVGLDNQYSPAAGPRIEVHQGDLRNQEDLERAAAGRKFDLIVEDASHERDDNLRTLFWMWPHLKEGNHWKKSEPGIYVIEEFYNVQRDRECFGVFGAEVISCSHPFNDGDEELLVKVTKR